MDKSIRLWDLAATLMFCAAVFEIAGDRWWLAAAFFSAAACFYAVGQLLRRGKREKKDGAAAEKETENVHQHRCE